MNNVFVLDTLKRWLRVLFHQRIVFEGSRLRCVEIFWLVVLSLFMFILFTFMCLRILKSIMIFMMS